MSTVYNRCQAMKDAGIKNPESQKGKEFCTNHCPYDKCVVYEYEDKRAANLLARANRAKDLIAMGYSVEAIAKMMKKDKRTIERYLAR